MASLLWRNFLRTREADLRARARGAVNPEDIRDIAEQQRWFKQQLELLDHEEQKATAVAGLLAWLNQVPEEAT